MRKSNRKALGQNKPKPLKRRCLSEQDYKKERNKLHKRLLVEFIEEGFVSVLKIIGLLVFVVLINFLFSKSGIKIPNYITVLVIIPFIYNALSKLKIFFDAEDELIQKRPHNLDTYE